jgi:hypothetical protein
LFSASGAFQNIIWNIKRQNVQVYFSEVTSSVHGIPAMFTAKPPANVRNRRLCLSAPNDATHALVKQHRRGCRTGGPSEERIRPRSDPAIIHPRFAPWIQIGQLLICRETPPLEPTTLERPLLRAVIVPPITGASCNDTSECKIRLCVRLVRLKLPQRALEHHPEHRM